MNGYTIKVIADMGAIHDGAVKLAGAELGVESFGLQVLDLPAGFAGYPEHDHAEDGQEEVYVPLRGSGTFEINGERVSIAPGQLLRIDSASRRKLLPGPDGVTVLAVGGLSGAVYVRPEHFRLAVPS